MQLPQGQRSSTASSSGVRYQYYKNPNAHRRSDEIPVRRTGSQKVESVNVIMRWAVVNFCCPAALSASGDAAVAVDRPPPRSGAMVMNRQHRHWQWRLAEPPRWWRVIDSTTDAGSAKPAVRAGLPFALSRNTNRACVTCCVAIPRGAGILPRIEVQKRRLGREALVSTIRYAG